MKILVHFVLRILTIFTDRLKLRNFGSLFLIVGLFSFSSAAVPLCSSFFLDAQAVLQTGEDTEKRITDIIDKDLVLKKSNLNPFARLVEDLESLYEESYNSENSIRHREELRAWKALQEQALSRDTSIEYHEYVELSCLYMLIATDIVKKSSSNFERSRKIAKKIADVLAANYPHLTYIFTSRALGANEFNRISGEPIFYVGLTNEKLYVDLTRMNPFVFFAHDMNHAAASLNLFGPNIPRKSTHLGFNEDYTFQSFPAFVMTEKQKEQIAFWSAQNVELRNKIFASLANERSELLKNSVNTLWFFLYHELSIKMTKHALKEELIRLSRLSDNLIYTTAEEMQDPSNWVYYMLKETMESQGIKSRKNILKGLREGIDWMLKEL